MRKLVLVLLLVGVAFGARAEDATVTQSHITFGADSVTLKAGESITFSNKDDVIHNIQIVDTDGDVDDKGLQKPGQDIKETFAKAGAYKIRCAIHPKMKMSVTVE
jgi:plastocyanin